MSQRIVNSWLNTNVPGAYVNTSIVSGASGLATSGVIVLMGEADGGPDFSLVNLKDNHFSPSQFNKVKATYTSGPIVDAFMALAAPSNDPDIAGTASSVYVIKTNKGSQASGLVDTDYGTFRDKNFGIGGNLYKWTNTSLAAEVAPTISGSVIAAFGAPLNGLSFSIRANGGIVSTLLLSNTASDHNSVASLCVELNNTSAFTTNGLVASAGPTPLTTIKITMTADSAAYRKGWGKSFELIDSIPGDLAALGLLAGLVVSSQEPAIEIQVTRSDTGTNSVLDVIPAISMTIGYAGASTLTITSTTLSTTGANPLSIVLSHYNTIKDLASFINSQAGYSCSNSPSANQLPVSALDLVSGIGIGATGAFQPGRIKNATYAFGSKMATSPVLDFIPTAVQGLPAPSATSYLAGGLKGGTLSADIVTAIQQIVGIQCNIIIPLFSQDASADKLDGLTDNSSTYTISAINELIKTHCLQYSTPTLKKNRMAILSIWGTYAEAKAEAQSIGSYRCAMSFQKCTSVNSAGLSTSFLPWYGSVIAGGMQAGGFYKSICNHYVNLVSFTDPTGYDNGDPSDVSDALTAGLLALTQDTGGIKEISDQTCYGLDTNFVMNSLQAVYLSDILALDLGQAFQQTMVGKSLADISAASAMSFLQQRFDYYKKLKMVSSSSDAPLGYKNASIQISAPSMFVAVEAKLTTSLYFVAIDLALSAVQSQA